MEILTRLNWIDVIVIIVMIRISYVAFQDGLSHEIFPFIGVICTIVLALRYYYSIAIYLSQNIMLINMPTAAFLSFLGLVIVLGVVFKLLRRVVDLIVKVSWHPVIEKFGGLTIGITKASIVVSIILIILALLPLSYIQWSIRDKSLTGMSFLRIGPEIYVRLAGFLPAAGGAKTSVSIADSLIDSIVRDKSVYNEKNRQVDNKPKREEELQKNLTSKPSGT